MSIAALTQRLSVGPVPSVPSPKSPEGTEKNLSNQFGYLGSPGSLKNVIEREERAEILEFDGGENRTSAEREAASAMRVFQYRLTDRPEAWLVMLAPNCVPENACQALTLRFGPERLIEVREHCPAPKRQLGGLLDEG
jgi:hypothetical protein